MQARKSDLTINQVKRAVYSWSIRFREAVYDNHQLAFLSDEYHEDMLLLGVTSKQFAAAERTVRQRCKYFPKVADILDAVKEYRANPPASDSLQIEDQTAEREFTPEELETNKQRVRILMKVATREITQEEGEMLQAELMNG